MTAGIGSIRGQIRIDAKQALSEYAAVRASNAKTRASLGAASSSFARVGVGALAAAAPIVLLFKAAVGAAADFQKKIDFFGAVTNASQKDMDAVAKKALDMSKTTVFSAAQMADAMVEFGKAGIETKDIIGGVADATANLAQAADIKVGEAANTIVAIMSTFHIAAKDTNHIADQLSGAANASIIDVTDLATSMKYAGGIAAATKVPFESLVTAIALLGNAGIRGSTAGTSLRQIMISLVNQTPKAAKELKALGIITKNNTSLFIDQHGHIKPLADIFQILQDHTRKLTDAQRLAALKIIFNSRALASANILLREGAKGFDKMSASIGKTKAADVASKRLNNLAGDLTHLKNTFQTTLIQVGGPLQSALRPLVQLLTKMLQIFGDLPAPVQKFIIMALLVAAAFLIIFGTLALFISATLKIIQVFRDFRAALILLRGGIGTLITGLRALAVALLANPVFLLIAAIVLLVVAFVVLWNKSAAFRNFWKKLWSDIVDIAKKVWSALVKAFTATIDWIVKAAKAAWSGIMNYLVKPVVEAWKAVVDAFKAAAKWVGDAVKNVIDFVKKHWTAIIVVVLGPLGLLIDLIHKHWDSIVHFTEQAWNAIVAVVKKVVEIVTALIKLYVAIWVGIFHVFIATAEAIWNALVSFFTTLWNGIKAVSVAIWNAITGFLTALWHGLVSALKAIFTPILAFFSTLWHGAYNLIAPIVRAIAHVVESVFRALMGPVRAIWSGLTHIISSAASTIYSIVRSIISHIIHAFAGAGSWLINAGKQLIEGLWNGISSMVGGLLSKIGNLGKSIVGHITSFFGISSPSKLFHWIGTMLGLGLQRGIEAQHGAAVAAAARMASAVSDASQVQSKYASLADSSGLNASKRANATAATASQINRGKAQTVHVKVDDNRGTPKSAIGRQTTIHKVEINNPAVEPASDSLYHTVQKIVEDII